MMMVDRIIGLDGSVEEKISITEEESSTIDHCHEILRRRFEERGELYSKEKREMCEWWLQGILRHEGIERMVHMAQNAIFHSRRRLITSGYAETVETEEV